MESEAAAARMLAFLEDELHMAMRGGMEEVAYDHKTNTKMALCGRRVHVSMVVQRYYYYSRYRAGVTACNECLNRWSL